LSYYNSNAYNKRPNFKYLIEFSTTVLDTVFQALPSGACDGRPTQTLLPFRITNLTTGKKVVLQHNDRGALGENIENTGYKDCTWTVGEDLLFYGDSLRSGNNDDYQAERTYFINIKYLYLDAFSGINIVPWESGRTYSAGDYVLAELMVWRAETDVNETIDPTAFVDTNSDGINDNPWKAQYPWNDGDTVVIRPKTFYVDGDSWVADLSTLGAPHEVTQEELDRIKVVPNPYMVHSRFNETEHERRLRFTNLPQHCTITIYTVSGEKVISFRHDDEYDSNEFWNVRTINNQEVAPGLYLYTVEAGGKKHIGKFAVVR